MRGFFLRSFSFGLSFVLIACGDASSHAPQSVTFYGDRSSSVWSLKKANGLTVEGIESAELALNPDLTSNTVDCSGAVYAQTLTALQLVALPTNNPCMVEFPPQAELYRNQILQLLQAGAQYQITNSTLTLRDTEAKLVFEFSNISKGP